MHHALEAFVVQNGGVNCMPFHLERSFSYFYSFNYLVHEDWRHFLLWSFQGLVHVRLEGAVGDRWWRLCLSENRRDIFGNFQGNIVFSKSQVDLLR